MSSDGARRCGDREVSGASLGNKRSVIRDAAQIGSKFTFAARVVS